MARGGRQGWATGAAAFWGAATLAATLCGEVGAHVPGGLAAVEGTWSAPLEVLGDRRSLLSSFKAKKKMKKKQKNRKFGRGSPSLGVDSVSDVAGDYALPPDEDFNSIYDVTGDYVLPPDEDFNSIDDVTGDYVAPQPRDFEGFSPKSDLEVLGDRRSLLSSFKAKKKMKKKQKNRKFGRGSPSLGVDSVSDVAGDYALPPDEDFNSIYDVTGDYVLPPDEDFNSIDDVTGDYVAPQPRDFEGFSPKSDASFAGTAGEIFDRVLQYAASTDKEFDDDGFLACLREILKRQENDEGFEWDYTC